MKATTFFCLSRSDKNLSFFPAGKVRALLFFVSSVVTLIFGCSGCAQMYTGFQSVGVQQCHELSYPEQQECLEEVGMSYEEYEEDREKSKEM